MPVIHISKSGARSGVAPSVNSHPRGRRSVVQGWTPGACRRNTDFLRSVDIDQLPMPDPDSWEGGCPVSFSLTVRDCPASPVDWSRLRFLFLQRLNRGGAFFHHWVVEWQRRGVPHLHGVVWLPPERYWGRRVDPFAWVVGQWLAVNGDNASILGQHAVEVHDVKGWNQYLSKHASRGVENYQRSPENIPPQWQGKTGRVWGYGGKWPIAPKFRLHYGLSGFHMVRRIWRGWRLADARSSGNLRRIVYARTMLKCNSRPLSTVRGVSEWIPEAVNFRIMGYLSQLGVRIESD